MTKIYLVCGFIGSGKTTFAKELARSTSAFRFSIDEWMIPLFGEHMTREEFNHRLGILTELFKESTEQMVNLGIPVILDFGFWYKEHRVALHYWAESISADYELVYLKCSYETCRERAIQRNKSRSSKSYEMTDEMLSMFWSWFEEPTEDEKVTIIQSDA